MSNESYEIQWEEFLEKLFEEKSYTLKNETYDLGDLKVIHVPEYQTTILGKWSDQIYEDKKEDIILTTMREGIPIRHNEFVISLGNGPWIGSILVYYQGSIGWLWCTEVRDANILSSKVGKK